MTSAFFQQLCPPPVVDTPAAESQPRCLFQCLHSANLYPHPPCTSSASSCFTEKMEPPTSCLSSSLLTGTRPPIPGSALMKKCSRGRGVHRYTLCLRETSLWVMLCSSSSFNGHLNVPKSLPSIKSISLATAHHLCPLTNSLIAKFPETLFPGHPHCLFSRLLFRPMQHLFSHPSLTVGTLGFSHSTPPS